MARKETARNAATNADSSKDRKAASARERVRLILRSILAVFSGSRALVWTDGEAAGGLVGDRRAGHALAHDRNNAHSICVWAFNGVVAIIESVEDAGFGLREDGRAMRDVTVTRLSRIADGLEDLARLIEKEDAGRAAAIAWIAAQLARASFSVQDINGGDPAYRDSRHEALGMLRTVRLKLRRLIRE